MATESFSRLEIVEIVKMVRLTLYNRGLPCGPKAIQKKLAMNSVQPPPSLTTIKRILTRHCLTHRRTGHYP
jgi:putative transposase